MRQFRPVLRAGRMAAAINSIQRQRVAQQRTAPRQLPPLPRTLLPRTLLPRTLLPRTPLPRTPLPARRIQPPLHRMRQPRKSPQSPLNRPRRRKPPRRRQPSVRQAQHKPSRAKHLSTPPHKTQEKQAVRPVKSRRRAKPLKHRPLMSATKQMPRTQMLCRSSHHPQSAAIRRPTQRKELQQRRAPSKLESLTKQEQRRLTPRQRTTQPLRQMRPFREIYRPILRRLPQQSFRQLLQAASPLPHRNRSRHQLLIRTPLLR